MPILAIDIGTSAIKLMRLNHEGQMLSVHRVPCRVLDVPTWTRTIRENIAAQGDAETISAISVTGQMHGLLTRENGGTWGSGIPWHDQRSADMIPALRQVIGERAVTATGGPLATGFQAASLAWLRAHERGRWSRILRVYLPKDALIHELTGRFITDPSDAAGTGLFAPERGDWAWEIVDALRIPRPWLPEVIPSGSVVGQLTGAAAEALGVTAGIPVIVAGGDAAAGAWGAGVTRDGDVLVMLSSGAQIILPTTEWAPDPHGRWYTWPSATPADHGHAPYLSVGTLLNGGNIMDWADTALVEDPIADHPTGMIALPHLIGTRENPLQRGGILGITPETTPGEVRRALVEGVAFSLRGKLEEMISSNPLPSRVRIGGGLARLVEIRQLFADVLRIPVEQIGETDLSAYGAGLLALETQSGAPPNHRSSDLLRPDEETATLYDTRYTLYCRAEDALSPLMGDIAQLRPMDQ